MNATTNGTLSYRQADTSVPLVEQTIGDALRAAAAAAPDRRPVARAAAMGADIAALPPLETAVAALEALVRSPQARAIEIKDEVQPLVLKENAIRSIGLCSAAAEQSETAPTSRSR